MDGLEYNITNSVHPNTILFDLTEGFVENKVDFVNCIEVVEHIDEKYIHNLLDTLSQGNYILITHAIPGQKGHHHVNCQPSEYWIKHLESYGYIFLENESEYIRKLAEEDGAVHVIRNGLFFSKLNLEN